MTVNLTGVADVQRLTVTVKQHDRQLCSSPARYALDVNMLIGDTSGNKTVSASDVGQTKAQAGVPVTAANFREDVIPNGSITARILVR